jgi:PilZ domain
MLPSSEKRSHQRLGIRMPAKILIGSSEVPAYTRNLSREGFFLEFHEEISCGDTLELIMLMPTQLIGGFQEKWYRCRALVKRIESDAASHSFGIAGQFTFLQAVGADIS